MSSCSHDLPDVPNQEKLESMPAGSSLPGVSLENVSTRELNVDAFHRRCSMHPSKFANTEFLFGSHTSAFVAALVAVPFLIWSLNVSHALE
jgi:hypothetical protein